jgi:hypothetical protein
MSKKHKGSQKTFASKRTMNPPQPGGSHQANTGDNKAFQQHDVDRRLGDYEGTGNHARTGNRGHQ